MATAKTIPVSEDQQAQMELNVLQQCDEVITHNAQRERFGWFDLGSAARVINDKKGWERLAPAAGQEPFHSFEDYIQRRSGKGRSTVFRAVQLVTEFSSIAEDDLRAIPVTNAMWLLKLKQRKGGNSWATEKWLKLAQESSEEDFAEVVNESLPGAAKEEQQFAFKIPLSLKKIYDKVMKVAKWNAESTNEIDGLEEVLSYYLNGQHEGSKAHVSNLDAFNNHKAKKPAAKASKKK